MKKFMSVLLAFAMVFACLPIQGGAAEEDTQYTEATIDFSDVANRTGYSTTQQVWEQNGITVTNNKGSSTTNIGDYYNPVKFYKNSQLIVACNGMIQIVFAANTTGYASDLNSAITAAGFTSSVSEKIVTVAFDEPVDSFEVTLSTAKVFMDSITVTVPATSEPKATVSFDLNYDGATGAPGNATIIVGGTYGTLPQVSREGYTFDGWFKDAAYTGTAVEATDTVTEDHVLYAKWTAKPVATVSFDLNGEDTTDAPEAVTVIVGSTYEALPTVSREGYIFGGWFTDIGCIGTAVKATDVVNESHTLYAKWTEAVEGEISEITIDFSTTDQRTGYSTEQQAWTNGALTFTNDKDTSTTDVGDYSNPVRLYKNSSVTIACAGMTQIVIVSTGTSDYKANLTGSLDAAGVTYTTSDDTYTILLAEPADTFTVSLSAGQARFKSITVIASTSGGEAPNPTPEETEPTSIEHFTYTTDGTNLTITGYTGTDAEVVISGTYTIDGTEYTVTAIGDNAFRDCTGLTSVTIPGSITTMGMNAFRNCKLLASVIIPDSVTSIGMSVFNGCTGLTSVAISNNLTSISDYAFSGCNSLTQIIIPDSVTSIKGGAFRECIDLTSITIGSGVNSISDYAFGGCVSLTGIWVNEENTSLSNDDSGVLFDKDKTKLLYAPEGISGSYTIPNSVNSINDGAFADCTDLISIIIPDGVSNIGESTFWGCSGLTTITIGKNVTSIDDFAFYGCSGLMEITIPNGVISIGAYAFENCSGLASVSIPNSVTSIGTAAFNGCTGMTAIWVGEENTSFSSDNSGVLFNKDKTTLIRAPWRIMGNYTVPDGVINVDVGAFSDCTSLGGVSLPTSVMSIGSSAFSNCTNLSSITIPNGVTGIGDWTFNNCISLTEFYIPDSVTSVGEGAFYSCTGLNEIVIPKNVTIIAKEAFTGCTALTAIWVDSENPNYSNDSRGALLDKNKTNLIRVPGGMTSKYTVPESVTQISSYAFSGCTSLSSVTIGNGVISIGFESFYNCNSLNMVYYLGTEEQRAEMTISQYGNDPLINATWLFSQIEESTSTIVKSWGITLNDEVVVKFNMIFTPEILADEAAYVEVKVGSTTMNVPVSQVTGPIQVPVTASQMTEKITLSIVDGNGVSSEADSFTVRQYCDTILGDEEYAKYHALVKEMLNYGSAAQLYFGKNTGELAGEGITDAGQQEVPTTGGEYVMEGHIEGLECYGATLVLRDKIGLRYYFTGDLTGCTFAVNGVPTELQIGNGNYVELADILPQDLDEDVDLVVTDANGNTINVTYCPMNYIIRMNQKGTDATKAVVKALYNYHLAAKVFSDSQTA